MTATRLGPAAQQAAAVVIAVHGRGQSAAYMIEHVVSRLRDQGRDSVAFVLPEADGNTWYPVSFLAELQDNQPALDDALAAMATIEAELADVDPAKVIWLGYSQGACLLAEHLARRPRRWGGAAILTGGMIGPADHELTINGGFDGMPAYFSNGDADEWVPLWRTRATSERFSAAGADMTLDVFPGRGHEIGAPEIVRVQAMLDLVMS